MNKRQKEILQAQLDNEKAVLKQLESNYEDALGEIDSKIAILMARQDADMQHVIYQVEYQKALRTQVQAILENLQANEFTTISEYLTKSYEDGFIGTMYDLQGQGIPLIFPIDQKAVVDAIQNDTKLSESLYTRLGHDITDLKKKITGEISRGLSSGQMFSEISRNIASWARIPKNNAMRITRTEAHRIQVKATSDAQHKAKEKGADVVKQWDSTLDSRTRESHVAMDGEIAELDDTFSNGLEYPGDPKGSAEEVINCRCALLQRARWALGNDYTKWSEDAEVVYSDDGTAQLAIIEAKNYSEFAQKYSKAVEKMEENGKIVYKESATIEEAKKFASDVLGFSTVDYDKFNIDVANMVNRATAEIYNVFGNLSKSGHLAGVRLYPKKASWYAAYSPGWKEVFMKNVSAKTATAKMAKDAKEQFGFGFWSTANAEQAIRHELGHAIQHMYTDKYIGYQGTPVGKLKEIHEIREKIMESCGITKWDITDSEEHRKAAGNIISYYALKNDGEFIAESVAEYMGGNPRETAKKVIEILLREGD